MAKSLIDNQKFCNQFINSVGIEFVFIKGGSFIMGKSNMFDEGGAVETPLREVKIRDFFISKFPITQEQYFRLTKTNPSYYVGKRIEGENSRRYPVERVNWYEAKSFCETLNRYEGLKDCYFLPSEAQWEYIAKAGCNYRFTFGDSENMLEEYAVYDGNHRHSTAPVDLKKPNFFGIYSLLGNVWEWCEDDYFPSYKNAPCNGIPYVHENATLLKVKRGGSYKTGYFCLRSSFRGFAKADASSDDLGFRIAINNYIPNNEGILIERQ